MENSKFSNALKSNVNDNDIEEDIICDEKFENEDIKEDENNDDFVEIISK